VDWLAWLLAFAGSISDYTTIIPYLARKVKLLFALLETKEKPQRLRANGAWEGGIGLGFVGAIAFS
jgi:hypothetical protein